MKLHTREFGDSENRSLVFLHGFLGSGEDWLPVVQDLESCYHCTLVDLPGHGGSADLTLGKDCGLDETTGAVAAILENLDKPVLIGYSMGGRVALLTAIQHSDLLGGLVLESANPGLKTKAERERRVREDSEKADELVKMGVRAFVEHWYQGELFSSLRRTPEKLAALTALRSIGDPEALAAALRQLSVGRQPSLWEKLDELDLPVLIVTGELDVKYGAIGREMADRFAQAELAVMAAAGHNTHFEQPESFLRSLSDFLEYLS